MSEGKIIVGLDIGTTKVACIVGRRTENKKIEILGYGKTVSTGVKRGVVTNICVIANAVLIKTFLPECNVVVNPDLVASGDRELGEAALDVMASLGITVLGR